MKQMLFAVILLFSSSLPSPGAQLTFGDCSPIVNLNLDNKEALAEFIRTNYSGQNGQIIQLIVDVTACASEIDDDTKRLRALIFAIDQMLIVKRSWYIPALDRYINSPTLANFESMRILGEKNLKRIEEAIDALVVYEAGLNQISDESAVAEKTQTLEAIGGSLQSRLTLKLQQPLGILFPQSAISPQQIQAAMIQYRENYVRLVGEIEIIVKEMRQYLTEKT